MNDTINIAGLFVEGIVSFFSPCILPLLPLYIGYLTSQLKEEDRQSRWKTFLITVWFVLGISVTFFIGAIGIGTFTSFFNDHVFEMRLIGGILLVVLGLYSLNVIQIPFLNRQSQIRQFQTKYGFLNAFLFGFFFSFAWSPCIGPLLASAIVLSANASTPVFSILYVGAYFLGFAGMFLLLGLFTKEILGLIKKHKSVLKYIKLLGGILILLAGIYMLFQAESTYRSSVAQKALSTTSNESSTEKTSGNSDIETYSFTLDNSLGTTTTLSQYKGQRVVLNFFATWCTYCNQELPSLQQIQDENEDIKVLMVAVPNRGLEKDVEGIKQFMKDKGYSLDVLFDTDGAISSLYGVRGYPTTFIIKPDGNFYGMVPGFVAHEKMLEYLEGAKEVTSK